MDDMSDSHFLGHARSVQDVYHEERADAAANRTRIVETAERLFAARGVAAVTMADVAAEAGVGKGTLYRRFGDKGELCLALMDNQLRAFQNIMLDRMRQTQAQGVGPLARLQQFLDAWVHFTDEQLPLLCEVQRHGVHADDHSAPYFWLHLTVVGLLRGARAAGEVDAATDVVLAADLLLAPLRAQSFQFLRQERGFSLADISRGLTRLAAGLTPSAPGSQANPD
jgi:AcrR family transcriptional regulator